MKLLGKEIVVGDIVVVCEDDYDTKESEVTMVRVETFSVADSGPFKADSGLAYYVDDLCVIWPEETFEEDDLVDVGDTGGFWDTDGWTYVCKFKDKYVCYYKSTNEVEIWDKVREHEVPFNPKEGDDILVSKDNKRWVRREFLFMHNEKWVCDDFQPDLYHGWKYAKALENG